MAKIESFWLNFGGNFYSNVITSLGNEGSVLLFNIKVYDNIMYLVIKKNFENINVLAE